MIDINLGIKELYPKTIEEARRIQESLVGRFEERDIGGGVKFVCGADVSYLKSEQIAIGAMVVVDAGSGDVIQESVEEIEVDFPYVPGYLSFREIPALLKAYEGLNTKVDLILVDGQGRAHPRGMGLATHLGIIIEMPTIGVAKSKLVGEYELPGNDRGDFTDLTLNGKIIGKVVRTRTNVKPVFVSAGNLIYLDKAVELVLRFCSRYKLPDPIRYADRLAGKKRLELRDNGIV